MAKDTTKYIVIAVIVLVSLVLLSKLWQTFGAMILKPFNDLGDTATVKAVVDQTGTDQATASRMLQVVKDIHKAFHSSWDEDEDAAINALNSAVTVFQVKLVCQLYQQQYGLSLKSEFGKYVTSMDLFANPLSNVVTENWY